MSYLNQGDTHSTPTPSHTTVTQNHKPTTEQFLKTAGLQSHTTTGTHRQPHNERHPKSAHRSQCHISLIDKTTTSLLQAVLPAQARYTPLVPASGLLNLGLPWLRSRNRTAERDLPETSISHGSNGPARRDETFEFLREGRLATWPSGKCSPERDPRLIPLSTLPGPYRNSRSGNSQRPAGPQTCE